MKLSVNLNAWKNKTKSAKKAIRSKATVYVRAKALAAYKTVLQVSPQYSGNYVYNWAIELTGFVPGYSSAFKVTPWQANWENRKHAGHPDAIQAALRASADDFERIKWNSNIRLVNNAPVAAMLEAGEVSLRPENLVSGNMTVLQHLKTKYKFVK